MKKDRLCKYLQNNCMGSARAATSGTLERELSISGNELRRQVNRLRREGIPIASGKAGYYYAVNAGEVYITIRDLKKMESGLKAAIEGLERSMTGFSQGERS